MSSCSRKKTVVATYTGKAEYIALCMVCKEAVWSQKSIGDILGEISTSRITLLCCDSASAIKISANECICRRNKHINITCHFILATLEKDGVPLTCSQHQNTCRFFDEITWAYFSKRF